MNVTRITSSMVDLGELSAFSAESFPFKFPCKSNLHISNLIMAYFPLCGFHLIIWAGCQRAYGTTEFVFNTVAEKRKQRTSEITMGGNPNPSCTN